MEIIILGFVLGIGIAIGWVARERVAMRIVDRLIKEAEEAQTKEQTTEDRTKMRLERHGNLIYAFDVENDSFIAQGKDLEDLDTAIVARFPGKKFSVQEQNLIDIKANYHESV
jgi:hypothetical protein